MLHPIRQSPGPTEGFGGASLELNLRLVVALKAGEAPVNALAAVSTDEVAAIVKWFGPALD
jgi:hypothetical protein